MQCITAHDDMLIVCMTGVDHAATSRNIAQLFQSVTHHSLFARTIRRRLQKSGISVKRPLLRLPLNENQRCLRHQWCDERRTWAMKYNDIMFIDKFHFCMQHHDSQIRV
ncbi:transposable element Tc1 transposase [Trichonephila clavipes]|nr:transposable element Tc1 transposase [Trichonephila clavipes]